MKKNKTEELLKRLKNIRNKADLKSYIDTHTIETSDKQLADYILEICNNKGYKKSDIIRNSDINRTYGYQILSGFKSPSRDKLLQICVGNNFTREHTNKALTIANFGMLYAKNPRDSIIIYSLNNNLNLIETNIILHEHGYRSLGED